MERNGKTDRKMLEYESRFFKAIKEDDGASVRLLLENERFKAHLKQNDKLSLAFLQVVLYNNVHLVKLLMDSGVDVQSTDCMFEENGLMHAARYGHQEMLNCLLEAGIDVNHQGEDGSTALHVAVANEKHQCVEILAKHKGVNLNVQDCSGYSPLLWAARLCQHRSMKILIDAGCNVESRDFGKGSNALHILVDEERAFGKGKHVRPAEKIHCINLLVNAGLDVNEGDVNGSSPLFYAIKFIDIPVLKHLLKLNCNTKCTEEESCTIFSKDFPHQCSRLYKCPLGFAISRLQFDAVKCLFASGVKYHTLINADVLLDFLHSQHKIMYNWVIENIHNPLSLKLACRNTIRSHLKCGDISKDVQNLNLPVLLTEFVNLSDLDNNVKS